MDNKEEEILRLLGKFQKGEASNSELRELDSWYNSFEKSEKFTIGLSSDELTQLKNRLFVKINTQINRDVGLVPSSGTNSAKFWLRIVAAACLLLSLSVGGYFLINHSGPKVPSTQQAQHDIGPGGNKAILTLANGKQIVLTDAKNGRLASQGNTQINKAADGELTYNSAEKKGVGAEIQYNTMSIPKGGTYSLKLVDGSKIWLNSATVIRYPESFTGNERKMELLSGEAYFEIAHNRSKPFKVVYKDRTIEVIGTHFNVNAYQDEPYVKTTLTEGSIKIVKNGIAQVLKPGEQATDTNGDIIVSNADPESAIAWKNGFFMFNSDDLPTIMRKISRWYNVDVVYKLGGKDISKLRFGGFVARSKNLNTVLNTIERTEQVHFQLTGTLVTVTE